MAKNNFRGGEVSRFSSIKSPAALPFLPNQPKKVLAVGVAYCYFLVGDVERVAIHQPQVVQGDNKRLMHPHEGRLRQLRGQLAQGEVGDDALAWHHDGHVVFQPLHVQNIGVVELEILVLAVALHE